MKTTIKTAALTALFGCLAATTLTAQDYVGRWYIKADAGANWTDDTDFTQFFGPVTPGSEVSFDPGLRLGVAGGYHFTDFFAAEAELGIMANEIDSITGAWVADASFANVPLLVNGKFQFRNRSPFTPYVGVGAGFTTSLISVDGLQIGPTYMEGDEADVVFAWQALAGFRFDLNENMSLGFEYRYFASAGPDWETDVVIGTPSDEMSFDDIQTHAVSLAFHFTF